MSNDADAAPVALSRFLPSLGKFVMSLVGVIVAVVPVVALFASQTMRQFAKQHSIFIYVLLVIAIWIIVGLSYLAYYLASKNKALQQSEQRVRAALPSAGDRDMCRKIRDTIPPDSDLMRWLKLEFEVQSLPASSVRDLRHAQETLSLMPTSFTDKLARDGYEVFTAALSQFLATAGQWAKPDARGEELRIPGAWKYDQPSRYDAATGAIEAARIQLTSSYDALISICQGFGADA